MLIRNNEARVHHIGIRNPDDAEPNDSIRLLPGLNEVSPKHWEEALGLPVVQHYVKTKVFEVVETPAPRGASKTQPVSEVRLASLPEDKAVELVKQVLDRDLLLKWKADETRPTALDAIEEQLKLLQLSAEEAENIMGKPGTKTPKADEGEDEGGEPEAPASTPARRGRR